MAIDTSIYGRIRPFEMEDQFESASKAYAVKDQQKKYRLDRDMEEAGKASGGDAGKMADALLAKGHYQPALQLRAQATAQRKAQTEEKLKLMEAAGSDAMSMDTVWRQALQASNGDQAAALQRVQPIYMQIRQKWTQLGHQMSEQFNPDENFAAIGSAKEAVQYLKSIEPEYGSPTPAVNPDTKQPDLYQPPKGAGKGRYLGVQPAAAPAGPTELARYQAERAAMQPGDPRIPEHDRVIASFKGGRGTDITIQQPGPMEPGKAAATKVDEAILDTGNRLMRLNQIEMLYRPEFQELGTKISNKYSSLKAMAGVKLTNKERGDLTQFSAYRRNALENLNEYIRSVTGAVVNANEVPRLMGAMPNPGQGLFDGDDPVTFESKKNDILRMLRMGEARLAYIKRNGMSLEDGAGKATVPLDRMPQLINQRGREIEAQLKQRQPQADAKALQRAVRRQLSVEFGLVSD